MTITFLNTLAMTTLATNSNIQSNKNTIMTLEQLIKDYKLNQSVLAKIIGKSQAAFHEKLYQTRGNKFSHEQTAQIKQYLLQMSNKINELCQ